MVGTLLIINYGEMPGSLMPIQLAIAIPIRASTTSVAAVQSCSLIVSSSISPAVWTYTIQNYETVDITSVAGVLVVGATHYDLDISTAISPGAPAAYRQRQLQRAPPWTDGTTMLTSR